MTQVFALVTPCTAPAACEDAGQGGALALRLGPLGIKKPLRVVDPYTHVKHARNCRLAAQDRIVLQQWVQFRSGGAVQCGLIVDAFTIDGLDFWRLSTASGLRSMPCKSARQCSGIDGFCACSGEAKK